MFTTHTRARNNKNEKINVKNTTLTVLSVCLQHHMYGNAAPLIMRTPAAPSWTRHTRTSLYPTEVSSRQHVLHSR